MVSPTQLCWRYHSLPLRQRYDDVMAWKGFLLDWPFVSGILDSPQKGAVMRNFDVCFVVSLNKLLNKWSRCQWCGRLWLSGYITVMIRVKLWCFFKCLTFGMRHCERLTLLFEKFHSWRYKHLNVQAIFFFSKNAEFAVNISTDLFV